MTILKSTSKFRQGYKYYIYIRPGEIYYFESLQKAEDFRQNHSDCECLKIEEMF